MPKFLYTAVDGQGKEQKGHIEADNENDAVVKLKTMSLFPTGVSVVGGASGSSSKSGTAKKSGSMFLGSPKVKRKDLTIMTRQLTVLLEAGLPLVRSLRTLEKQAKDNPSLKRVMGDLANSVEGGSTFSEALALHKKTFNKLYVSMVRAGEASGALESVLARLAEFMEKAANIAGKVKAALVYPIAVLFVAGAIVTGLMIFIVPKFAKMFKEMLPDTDLPVPTQWLIATSNFMAHHFIALFVMIGIFVVMVKVFVNTNAGSYAVDWAAIKIPPLNSLFVRATVARFCRTLGTLMQSGVPILSALMIVKDTAGNEVVGRAIVDVHDAVKEGEGMTRPLEEANVFPGMVVSMIEVGEETGQLPEMLNRIADVYEEEVDRAVEGLTALIEPVMIVVLAIVVGGIVISLFAPLVSLIENL